jgi:predicted RND superfamily exporter protein
MSTGGKDPETVEDIGEAEPGDIPGGADEQSGNALWFSFGIERLGLLALKRPALSLLAILLVSLVAGYGVSRISLDDSLSELFRSDSEEFRRYELVAERFPSSEYDVLLVAEGPGLLARDTLDRFRSTILELGLGESVRGIVSLFSARRKPDETGYAAPVFPSDLPEGEEYDRLTQELRTNDIVRGKLLSDDGTLALVAIALDRETVQSIGLRDSVAELRELVAEGLEGTGLTWKLTGAPVMQLEIRNAVQRDRILYNGLGFALGALIAFAFFRSLSLTLIAAAGPAAAILWALGAVGLLDFRLNLFVNVITPLIMVNGFSDSMHLVYNIRRDVMAGIDRTTATRNAIVNVAPACFLTALTAAIAVASFIFAESALIRTFGAASTIAVLLAYIAVVFVVPTLAVFLIPERLSEPGQGAGLRPGDGLKVLAQFSVALFSFVGRHALKFVVLGAVIAVLSAAAYINLEPHYRLADQVPDREQALLAVSRLDEKLTGANPVHVMIEWPQGGKLYSEPVLKAVAEVHQTVERVAGIGNVWSITSLQRWLQEAGGGDLAQLEEYVGFLPRHLRERFISEETASALVTGRLPDADASEILPVVEKLDAALDAVRAAHPDFAVSVTGLPAIAARNSGQMIWALNVGLVSDMAVVILLLGVAFRSAFASLVSILPSMIPLLATGTLLYLTGQGLHFASMIALTVAFGLSLDSTIHFLNRYYLEARRAPPGEGDTQAILSRTAVMIGPVLILTTVVLTLGLGVTILSDLPSLRVFGQLSGATLIAALVAQLLILPAAISLGRRILRQ